MGRVLIEAMSAGVPVIGADVGGIPHIVKDGVNGYLFPKGDASALEERLRTLLEDPERAREMGAQGKDIARREYTEARWAEHFISMVEAAVKGLP
jgi:glycosyltransferase involved in cell wall biosynthesis